MINIDEKAFADAIAQTYGGLDEAGATGYARLWAKRLHPMLQEAVEHWIRGERISNVSYAHEGKQTYSIENIMQLRASNDVLQAMLLLSDYINDPRRGEASIMAPARTRRL